MLKRTITGIVAALFAVGVLAFRDTPALSIVVAIFTVIAAREIEKVIGIKNKAIYYISLVFSGLVPLFYEFRPELEQRGIVIPVTAVVVIYCVVLFMLMLTDFENTKFEEVASVIISTTFVPWSFSTLIFLNDMSETYPDKFDFHYDLFFILLGLFAAWLSDSFAYFSGRFFGKHKLCPKISPKKTVEGSLGGILFCALSFLVYALVLERYAGVKPDYVVFIIGGIFTSAVAQAGDLLMSAIKRSNGIKDFGRILPGHGGMLDRFDSVMAVSLILLLLESFFGLMR